jgi:glutathione S-transferase
MIRLRTTPSCPRSPRLAHALEEIGAEWEPVFVEEGWFRAHHGRVGPRFEDGDVALFEIGAVLRHLLRAHPGHDAAPRDAREAALLDEHLEDYASNIAPAIKLLAGSLRDGGAS